MNDESGLVDFIILIVYTLIIAFPFMWLWNYTIPYLFNIPALNWSRSLALIWLIPFLDFARRI